MYFPAVKRIGEPADLEDVLNIPTVTYKYPQNFTMTGGVDSATEEFPSPTNLLPKCYSEETTENGLTAGFFDDLQGLLSLFYYPYISFGNVPRASTIPFLRSGRVLREINALKHCIFLPYTQYTGQVEVLYQSNQSISEMWAKMASATQKNKKPRDFPYKLLEDETDEVLVFAPKRIEKARIIITIKGKKIPQLHLDEF